MNLVKKPYISIVGDSISTYYGYTPIYDVFYDDNNSSYTNINSVKDTWWMQVIKSMQSQLLVNDSYAGSTIFKNGYQGANSPWRISRLKSKTTLPDLILIFAGLNDVGNYVPVDIFKLNYTELLKELMQQYPSASIWASTLIVGNIKNKRIAPFVNWKSCIPIEEYNAAIRSVVKKYDVILADLASLNKQYQSIDGVHPDKVGMQEISEMWLHFLKEPTVL